LGGTQPRERASERASEQPDKNCLSVCLPDLTLSLSLTVRGCMTAPSKPPRMGDYLYRFRFVFWLYVCCSLSRCCPDTQASKLARSRPPPTRSVRHDVEKNVGGAARVVWGAGAAHVRVVALVPAPVAETVHLANVVPTIQRPAVVSDAVELVSCRLPLARMLCTKRGSPVNGTSTRHLSLHACGKREGGRQNRRYLQECGA